MTSGLSSEGRRNGEGEACRRRESSTRSNGSPAAPRNPIWRGRSRPWPRPPPAPATPRSMPRRCSTHSCCCAGRRPNLPRWSPSSSPPPGQRESSGRTWPRCWAWPAARPPSVATFVSCRPPPARRAAPGTAASGPSATAAPDTARSRSGPMTTPPTCGVWPGRSPHSAISTSRPPTTSAGCTRRSPTPTPARYPDCSRTRVDTLATSRSRARMRCSRMASSATSGRPSRMAAAIRRCSVFVGPVCSYGK